jgi:Ser/Thr protein kinase RdoA (MazF antagonist)
VEKKPSKKNYGLIHYDFECDNLILKDDVFHIIDFDDSIYSFYVADIAYALRDIFDHGNILDQNIFDRFVCGYKTATDIERDMLSQIPLFLKLHDLLTYIKLRRALQSPHDTLLDPRLLPLKKRLETITLDLKRSFKVIS